MKLRCGGQCGRNGFMAYCINRINFATCTDFFRHRAGDFLPPYRSTLPLKAQPVQALAEQVSIF